MLLTVTLYDETKLSYGVPTFLSFKKAVMQCSFIRFLTKTALSRDFACTRRHHLN